MCNMTFDSPRASFEQTLEFANRVRAAGGGTPLDALMPAVPADSTRCLVARNLNFNCEVNGGGPDGAWTMDFGCEPEDRELRDRIAEALGLEPYTEETSFTKQAFGYHVILPREIGQVAADFDAAQDLLRDIESTNELDASQRQLIEDMLPYIEAAVKDALDNGVLNEKGELIL